MCFGALKFCRMQEDKKETPPAAVSTGGKPPSFCHRLQRAFHARPAFRPLRRLTVSHQEGAAKPADAGVGGSAPAEPTRKHGGPPVPAVPPRPRAPWPAPRNVAKKAAGNSLPTGPPVPAPPPDVVTYGRSAGGG
jgi:hypothetical protein